MKKYNHQCVKPGCSETYTDEDVDAYYCTSCQEANKAIAAKIDAQHAGAPKTQPMSPLQEHDAATENIHGMNLLRVKA